MNELRERYEKRNKDVNVFIQLKSNELCVVCLLFANKLYNIAWEAHFYSIYLSIQSV